MCGQHLSHMSLKLLSPTHLTESELCEQAWLYNLYKDTLLSADGNKMGGSLALALGAAGCGTPMTLSYTQQFHQQIFLVLYKN